MIIAPVLRHRIDIQVAVESSGAAGNVSDAWETIRTTEEADALIPAQIRPMTARELLAAQGLYAGTSVAVLMRWRALPTDAAVRMRAVHDGVVYNIKGALPDETLRRTLKLACEAGVKANG